MVVREEFYVDSMDRVHMIHGYRWYDPEQEWIGVLQIIHGMLEYICLLYTSDAADEL